MGFVLESQNVDLYHVQHYDLIAESGRRKRIDLKGLLHKLLEMDVSLIRMHCEQGVCLVFTGTPVLAI